MHRQLQAPFLKNCIRFILCIIMSVPAAFGAESRIHSPVSIISLTNEQFENKLKQYIGIPYRRGGATTKGLDCSGFVRLVYDEIFGIDLPHNSVAQFRFSDLKKIDRNDTMQPGDLVFFGNKRKKRINHVGVYISDNQFIHASSSNGIKVSHLNERYWKKRFIGTKRHEDLTIGPDTGRIRFESSLKIPVNENGSIISYRRDDFSKMALKERNGTDNLDNPAFEMAGFSDSRIYLHEIGYTHSLSDGLAVNLSAIHENFDIFTAWPEANSNTGRVNYVSDEYLFDTADRLGFKLSSAFAPSNWLSITPSITYFDYSGGNEDILNAPQWLFGLNTVLLPAHKQWSLSMLLQYSEKDDFKDITSPYSRFSSLDLAVKLGVNITDNLQFSIMGEHDQRSSAYGVPGDSLIMDSKASNVSMSFDFSY